MKYVIKTEELEQFSNEFDVDMEYLGDVLFPNAQYDSVQFAWERVASKDALPLMAPVSALDAEAPISARPDSKRVTAEALFIKHKLNLTETQAKLKNHGAGKESIKSAIFDDITNLYRGVAAREEAMKMELLADGHITIKENDIDMVVDYEYPTANVFITDLSNPNTDVFELFEKVKAQIEANGKKLSYVLCSSRTLSLLKKNVGLKEAWRNSSIVITPTDSAFRSFLEATFEVDFVAYDKNYRVLKKDGTKELHRFYPEDRMTFVCGEAGASLGVGAIAPTPEDEMLDNAYKLNDTTVTLWNENDPAAQWTKVSSSFLPIPADVDSFYIVYTE